MTSNHVLGLKAVLAYAREVVGEERWSEFLERRSCDVSRNLRSARCRINVFCTARGVGLAHRLAERMSAVENRVVPVGSLDITTQPLEPSPTVCAGSPYWAITVTDLSRIQS